MPAGSALYGYTIVTQSAPPTTCSFAARRSARCRSEWPTFRASFPDRSRTPVNRETRRLCRVFRMLSSALCRASLTDLSVMHVRFLHSHRDFLRIIQWTKMKRRYVWRHLLNDCTWCFIFWIILMSIATKIVFLLLSLIVYFSKYMKDELKIPVYDKLQKVIKNLLFLLFICYAHRTYMGV